MKRVIVFVWDHPGYFFKLLTLKVFYGLVNVRPYWSFWHNTFSLIFLMPVYVCSVRVLIRWTYSDSLRFLCLTYLVLHVLILGLTVADWDGRFLVPVLPVVFLMAGVGFVKHSSGAVIAQKEALVSAHSSPDQNPPVDEP